MADVVSDKVVLELDARTARYLGNVRASRAEFDKSMQAMGVSAERMESRVSASGRRMSLGLNQAIAAIAVGAVVKETQVLADTWTQTGNKLAAAGVQTESLGARQKQLLDVARETRSEYGQTADIYARVTRSTQELNATDYQRLRVTELINKATKAGGATTAEQISTITQLGQALASGNLQGDELRSIRENSPLIAKAIATEFGVTIGELKKLGAEGELTSDRIFSAILKAGGAIDTQFAKTEATIGESFTYLKNEAIEFLGAFDDAVGGSTGIASFTQKVAEDFDLLAQAVIVSAALVGGALIGRITVPMQQVAVSNAKFVGALLQGRTSLQLEAEAARANARQMNYKAQADRDAARVSVVATQERINQLRQEAVAYQQNIALAEQQRAVAARAAATGRDSAGRFTPTGPATTDRNDGTRAVIANRMQLKRVTDELTVAEARLAAQHNVLAGALQRVTTTGNAARATIGASVIVARTAAVAMRGLGVAMSFFGGPLGLAITVIAGALAYFSTEAAKAEAAGDNLRSSMEEMEQSAGETSRKVDDLTGSQQDGKKASDEASASARGSASAYDSIAVAAANAAEYVKYLTAAQRQQRLEKLDGEITDLRRAQTGGGALDVFQTDNAERVRNARTRLLRTAGTGRSGLYDNAGQQTDRAWQMAQDPNASEELKTAAQDYANAVAVYNDNARVLAEASAARDVIYKSIDDPTLERPEVNTSNIATNGGGSGDSGGRGSSSGGRRGRASREETREELEARREMAELERSAQLQREAGAESLAQFTEDEITRRKLIAELIDQQYTPAQAEEQAKVFIDELQAAREVAAAAQRAEEARERFDEQREKDEEARLKRLEQQAFMQEQDLLLQRELASLAGDSERVKELDKILDRMQRIAVLQSQGGLTPEQAAERADNDQASIDRAETQGKIREWVRDPIKDALLEAFRGGDWGQAFADTIEQKAAEALGNAFDYLFNIIADQFANALRQGAQSSGQGGGGGGGIDWGSIFNAVGSFFTGGKKAAGGANFQAGEAITVGENGRERVVFDRAGRVLPNRTENAVSSGNVNIGLKVINATGVEAKATMERDQDGNMNVRLEPIMDEAIMSAGRRGVVNKAQKSTPAPKRRV